MDPHSPRDGQHALYSCCCVACDSKKSIFRVTPSRICSPFAGRFQDGEEPYPYVDPATGDKYYHNFVVALNGEIYRTRKTTRDNAAETVQKESKRSRNAERAPNQA